MRDFNKQPGDWMFKVVPWFIGFVFLLVLGIFIAYGVIAYKAMNSIPTGCHPALIQEQDHGQTSWTIGCKK